MRVCSYTVENDCHLPHPLLLALTVREDPESTADCRVFEVAQDDQLITFSVDGARQLLEAVLALHAQGYRS